jgi:hypothetical protein
MHQEVVGGGWGGGLVDVMCISSSKGPLMWHGVDNEKHHPVGNPKRKL